MRNIRKLNFLLIFLILPLSFLNSQTLVEKSGAVSFISSQNIYVKFESTNGIVEGDTLFLKGNKKNIPAVLVKFISSSSAAGEKISGMNVSLNDSLIAYVKDDVSVRVERKEESIKQIDIKKESETEAAPFKKKIEYYRNDNSLTGRFSVQSYSGISNYTPFGDYQRWRYNFSLNAKEISGSKFSFSSYMIYSYKASDWQKTDFIDNLRIYDFALNYSFTKDMNVWVGRHLNSKITNISSIDGVQFESNIRKTNYSYGFTAGSRPDLSNMGFNIKLFEFGGYISRTDTSASGLMENTLAVMQQTNDLKIDRRFLYLQHSSNLINNLNFFLSSEIDLYKMERGKGKNDFSLTGLYFSMRYTPARIISLSLSYDARKNVIYYETSKAF